MSSLSIERYDNPEGLTISTPDGIFISVTRDDDETEVSIGLDFGPDEDPLWVHKLVAERLSPTRTKLVIDLPEGKTGVVDFDYAKLDEDGQVALPVVR